LSFTAILLDNVDNYLFRGDFFDGLHENLSYN
jgi:hypothetical protein